MEFFRLWIGSDLGDVLLQIAEVMDDGSQPDRARMVHLVVVSAVDGSILVRRKKQLGRSMLTTIKHCRRTNNHTNE